MNFLLLLFTQVLCQEEEEKEHELKKKSEQDEGPDKTLVIIVVIVLVLGLFYFIYNFYVCHQKKIDIGEFEEEDSQKREIEFADKKYESAPQNMQ